MITLEDCIAFCGLSEEEVLAIAEHDLWAECRLHHRLPEAAACAPCRIPAQPGAWAREDWIRDMIVDDVRAAQARGDRKHVRTLLHVLHHLLKSHPQAVPPQWGRAAPGDTDP